MTDPIAEQIFVTRRSPAYWRVTFNHPPLNIFGPESIPELEAVVTALETDEDVKVVVFDSAVDGFFLTHYDFVAKLEDRLVVRDRITRFHEDAHDIAGGDVLAEFGQLEFDHEASRITRSPDCASRDRFPDP